MNIAIAYTFLALALIEIIINHSLLADKFKRSKSEIIPFVIVSVTNVISLISFGLMLIIRNETLHVWCRSIGLFGIGAFVVACLLYFLILSKCSVKVIGAVIGSAAIISICAYLMVVHDGNLQMIKTVFGYAFTGTGVIARYTLYSYKIISLIFVVAITIIITKKNTKERAKRFAIGLMWFDLCCLLDCVSEISTRVMLNYYIPVGVLCQTLGIIILYRTIISSKKNTLSIGNISEFIYYNVDTPILVFDDECKLYFINQYAEEFFEIDEETAKGATIESFLNIDTESLSKLKKVNNVKSRNTAAICNLVINDISDKYGSILGYIVFAYDQTEQYNIINKLEESMKVAESANKAKTDFLANMSHEIRTPINTILGMDEMILRETKDRFLVKYASDIKAAGNNLLTIINDILDLSKIEAGKLEIIPSEYDSESLLFDVINVMTFKAKEKGLKFVFDIDSRIPKKMIGDDVRIKQIMNNLLSNAVKYTTKGSVVFSVKSSIVNGNEADIQIAVSDTGCGIKKEDISKLFDAFTRVDETHNRTIEGTGLGLKITRDLLSKMNGVMNVKSVYGKGSTFSCSFRQEIKDFTHIGDFQKYYNDHQGRLYSYHKTFEAPNASILVVDDNQMNLNVVENLLKDTKIDIVTVLSGKDAIASTKTRKYDLVFMDHMMPEMDGIETLEAIKGDITNINNQTPFIVMTANAVKGAKEMYLEKGFVEYISKPVDPAKLEALIVRTIDCNKIDFVNTTVKELSDESSDESSQYKIAEKYLESNGINVVASLRNVNNNFENFNNILKAFVKGYNKMKGRLSSSFESRDSKSYGIEAHALKSNARTVGAENLSALAYKHEMAGREFRIETIEDSYKTLMDEWESVVKIIQTYLEKIDLERESKQNDDKNLKDISDAILKEKISSISELIDDYEHKEAMKEIEYLMDFKLPTKIKTKVKEAYRCLETIDYDAAAAVMKNIFE